MAEFFQQPAIVRLLASIVFVVAVVIARSVVARWIAAGAHILSEVQRRQMFYLRSAATAGILVGLVLIWASALQSLLLSLTAVMLAVVIATKELLMCLSGFLIRTTNRLFSVGDWIECNGMHGEVTDHTLLSTRVLELDRPAYGHGYTGRTLVLPNSLFVTHPVYTWATRGGYIHHRFTITVEQPVDPVAALERLRTHAQGLCEPFLEQAREINRAMDRRLGVDVAGPEPSVQVATNDYGKIEFLVLLFCPIEKTTEIQDSLSAQFLQAAYRGDLPTRPDDDATASPAPA